MSDRYRDVDFSLLEESLLEEVDLALTFNYSRYEMEALGVHDAIAEEIKSHLKSIVTDDNLRKSVTKRVVKEFKRREKERRICEEHQRNLDLQLFTITGGKIPCLGQCGYVKESTLEEVLEGNNNFLCKSCVDKFNIEGGSFHDIFKETNVYILTGVDDTAS